ncbi:hypothetical protein AB6A40_004473 [Gnathostoma spinigerum]|uniref:DUS-like FMN-binding domain-containing protein n=1 Tax=Gnathostoma spinigerum TaxID=75299 RepID=A0ABD6EK91_9BILA
MDETAVESKRGGLLSHIDLADRLWNDESLASLFTSRGPLFDLRKDCEKLQINPIPLRVAAPMVRYSKLPFRMLVRLYCADLVYTPMIYAKCFIASEYSRLAEYTTCEADKSTIVQFASNCPEEFALASEFVEP